MRNRIPFVIFLFLALTLQGAEGVTESGISFAPTDPPEPGGRAENSAAPDSGRPSPYAPAYSVTGILLGEAHEGFDIDGDWPCGDPEIDNIIGTSGILVVLLELLWDFFWQYYGTYDLALLDLYGLDDPQVAAPLEVSFLLDFFCQSEGRVRECRTGEFDDGEADATLYSAFYEQGSIIVGPEDISIDIVYTVMNLKSLMGFLYIDSVSGSLSSTLGVVLPASDLDAIPNPLGTGSILDLVVGLLGLYPDIDLNQDCQLDLDHDGYSATVKISGPEVFITEYDEDGVLNDGDGSGTPGDNPCAGGSAGCDDNCPRFGNAGQEDSDLDGTGDDCDMSPFFSVTKLVEGLTKPIDTLLSGGGPFGRALYVSEEGSGEVSAISPDGRVTLFSGELVQPVGLAFGPGGGFGTDMYVADKGNNRVKRITPAGEVADVVHLGEGSPVAILFQEDPEGNHFMYVTSQEIPDGGNVVKVDESLSMTLIPLGSFVPMDIHPSPGEGWPEGFYLSVAASPEDWRVIRLYEEEGSWRTETFAGGLDGLRGIEFVGEGDQTVLYMAEFFSGNILKADALGSVEIVAEGMDEPMEFLQIDGGDFAEGIYLSRHRPSSVVSLREGGGCRFVAPPLAGPVDLIFASHPFLEGLYVAEEDSGEVSRVTPQGEVIPLATDLAGPVCLVQSPGMDYGEHIYVTEFREGRIKRIDPHGGVDLFLGGLHTPAAMAFGPGGEYGRSLYVTEQREDLAGRVIEIDAGGAAETLIEFPLSWPIDIGFLPWEFHGKSLFITRVIYDEYLLKNQILAIGPDGGEEVFMEFSDRIIGFETAESGPFAGNVYVAENRQMRIGQIRRGPFDAYPYASFLEGLAIPFEMAFGPGGEYGEDMYVTTEYGDLYRISR